MNFHRLARAPQACGLPIAQRRVRDYIGTCFTVVNLYAFVFAVHKSGPLQASFLCLFV